MIHTKEPANKVFVFVTAYRGHESLEVNEKVLKGLTRTIKTYPGAYGNILLPKSFKNAFTLFHFGARSPGKLLRVR